MREEEITELRGLLEYRVGNPYAWERYDDGASELFRRALDALTDQSERLAVAEAEIAKWRRAVTGAPPLQTIASRGEGMAPRSTTSPRAAIERIDAGEDTSDG